MSSRKAPKRVVDGPYISNGSQLYFDKSKTYKFVVLPVPAMRNNVGLRATYTVLNSTPINSSANIRYLAFRVKFRVRLRVRINGLGTST